MHEQSLINDLIYKIEAIAHEQNAARVLSVSVRLGALTHISPEHLREHFEHAVHGTMSEGAQLEIQVMTAISDPQAQDILLDSVEVED